MANQSLYRAQIVLAAWDRERDANARPLPHLAEAFLPAVRLHLRQAYGWFLLAASGVEESGKQGPVDTVHALAAPEAGRMQAPELSEFAMLEADGWIAEMRRDDVHSRVASTPQPGLLGSDRQALDYAVAKDWALSLEALMRRMDDSLTEC